MRQKSRYKDYYSIKAKQENYPARSAYKIQEIDDKYRIFTKARRILDLGASPGAWTQVARERSPHAIIIACDLKPITISLTQHTYFFQEDVINRSAEFEIVLSKYAPYDIIMSDMAPQTTGVITTDAYRSLALCEEACMLATQYIHPRGTLVTKIFMGTDMKKYQQFLQQYFVSVHAFKPKSSKAESKEIFYIAQTRKIEKSEEI